MAQPAISNDVLSQERMDVDGAARALQAGPLKADSVAVLLGQALQAQDKALLEKCASQPLSCSFPLPVSLEHASCLRSQEHVLQRHLICHPWSNQMPKSPPTLNPFWIDA